MGTDQFVAYDNEGVSLPYISQPRINAFVRDGRRERIESFGGESFMPTPWSAKSAPEYNSRWKVPKDAFHDGAARRLSINYEDLLLLLLIIVCVACAFTVTRLIEMRTLLNELSAMCREKNL